MGVPLGPAFVAGAVMNLLILYREDTPAHKISSQVEEQQQEKVMETIEVHGEDIPMNHFTNHHLIHAMSESGRRKKVNRCLVIQKSQSRNTSILEEIQN